MAPDSEPKLFTEETLAATDRTGGDKTEVSSVLRTLHSAVQTWIETLARRTACLVRRTLAGRSPPVAMTEVMAPSEPKLQRLSYGPKPVRRVVIQTEACLTVAIGAEALLTCR